MAADLTSAIVTAIDDDPFGVADNVPIPNYNDAQLLVNSTAELSAALGAIMEKLETSARERGDTMADEARRSL